MKKAENLNELQSLFYGFIKEAIENEKYEVLLDEDFSNSVDGYIDGSIVIGGQPIRCSFNKKGYICFHANGWLDVVFDHLTKDEEKKLCDMAWEKAKPNAKKLIADYQNRIRSLESAMNLEPNSNEI